MIDLKDATAAHGGKAMNLAKLIQLMDKVPDYLVPDGFVVEAGEFEIREFESRLNSLGFPVALRSSALNEDGAKTSFAGQYDTVLNIQTMDLARAACLGVSRGTKRAASYAAAHGIGETGIAVIVQKMVPAESAGTIFTVDPVTGNRDHIIIEQVQGLGEKLVSGEITPDYFPFSRAAVLSIVEHSPQDIDRPSYFHLRLVVAALRLEEFLGYPQDMEWARVGDQVYLLQTRPITTL